MQLTKLKQNLVEGILNNLFPSLCCACERPLLARENMVCLHCQQGFNYLDTQIIDSSLEQLFWGKSEIAYAVAIFNYIQGESVQHLLHEFKYRNKKKLGEFFADILADELRSNPKFSDVSHLCFVPSSRSKKLRRGYNQAEILTRELSRRTKIPCLNLLSVRKKKKSQTTKNVYERHELLDNTFDINQDKIPTETIKHLLMIDDVITTGATTIACTKVIVDQIQIKVSVLALAHRNL